MRARSFTSIKVTVSALVLMTATASGASQNEPGSMRIEPYVLKGFKGQTARAELGHLLVPENRSNPASRQIELTFIRFRNAGISGPPLVYLVGGPGNSAYYVARYTLGSALQSALRQSGDLIFLEQRGTSKSNPNLKCDEEVNYPLDKPLELGELLRLYRESSGQCANRWRERGVDLTGYNTNESADDIEALRKSLGVEKLNLFGGSYGTHLALATVRRHETGINRVIIAGVEGPDHTYKLPSNLEKYL